MTYDISYKSNKADYLLSITALLQPVLVLIQLFMMDVLMMDADVASRYRVLLTAVPILFSMLVVIKRNFALTSVTYFITILVVMATLTAFPDRWEYMRSDLVKFTLAVVIPTGLCLASVNNFAVLLNSMSYVAISAAAIGLFYALAFISGRFTIEGYSMPFSYALLFPTFYLLNKKKLGWTILAVFMMIEMMAIGSRGAFILSLGYLFFTRLWGKVSIIRIALYSVVLLIVVWVFMDPLINLLSDLFSSIGIRSRTLRLIQSDELISYDSGREQIAETAWMLIDQRPIFGSGLWADRQFMGTYCHNIFRELFVDFGYVGGILIIIVFSLVQIRIFKKLSKDNKSLYILMLSLLFPLLVSSSYLTSFNVGMFMGFSYLQSRMQKRKEYQKFQI